MLQCAYFFFHLRSPTARRLSHETRVVGRFRNSPDVFKSRPSASLLGASTSFGQSPLAPTFPPSPPSPPLFPRTAYAIGTNFASLLRMKAPRSEQHFVLLGAGGAQGKNTSCIALLMSGIVLPCLLLLYHTDADVASSSQGERPAK